MPRFWNVANPAITASGLGADRSGPPTASDCSPCGMSSCQPSAPESRTRTPRESNPLLIHPATVAMAGASTENKLFMATFPPKRPPVYFATNGHRHDRQMVRSAPCSERCPRFGITVCRNTPGRHGQPRRLRRPRACDVTQSSPAVTEADPPQLVWLQEMESNHPQTVYETAIDSSLPPAKASSLYHNSHNLSTSKNET